MSRELHHYTLGSGTSRRAFLGTSLCLSALVPGFAAGADRWPSRPIVLSLLGPAGGGPDVVARELAERIGMALGQPIVIENGVGGSGIVGMDQARRASPDGHHFVFTHIGAMVMNPALFKALPYDPVRDFEPVSLVQTAPMILVVSPSLGVESLEQLIELARRKPGTLMYGSAGVGTPMHIFTEQFKVAKQVSMDHVPFKGSTGLVQALMGAHILIGMEAAGSIMPLIASGKGRPLAVTGDVRMNILPEVPTFAELGIPNIGTSWLAVMAPKGTMPEAVNGLNREIARVLAIPELQRAWVARGSIPGGGSPQVLAERIRTELPRWRQVIERAGIRPE
jgi:tripartite-type tricarboxylate transporter receptor subunit TctC